jgi:aminobenzoyl-glutamate utilization protein A
MHACGHDAHTVIGIGVLDAVESSDFQGTLKIFFQPAEERGSGAKPMVESGHADDLDYLFAVHVGLGYSTGEIVAGIDGFLAIRDFVAEFSGESAHAGTDPAGGRNALLAAAEAATSIHAIPRHSNGLSRINIGTIEGGSAPNIIAESATLQGQVRGETTEIMEYLSSEAERRLQAASDLYDVDLTIPDDRGTTAPSATSDEELVTKVAECAPGVDGVDHVCRRDSLDGSEDATHFMRHVQQQGGKACYLCIGTDHPDSHHTPHFDVDEQSIRIGADLVSEVIKAVGPNRE